MTSPVSQPKNWESRLAFIVETMREMSSHIEPQAMVADYSKRMREILPTDRTLALSRRGLDKPYYRITRSSMWDEEINPWQQKDKLPLFNGGFLSRLLYANEPVIIDDLDVSRDDPAYAYLEGQRSLMALPLFDKGESLNMVVLMMERPEAFRREELPDRVWMANLFGRATHNLVLQKEVEAAYDLVDHELKTVADIQRSLLPAELPKIPTMKLAAHYQTSRRAGGDYYDFFPLPDDRWGILIADVSGHGTPAAVVMAITHSIAHTYPGPPAPPCEMLDYVNRKLTTHYTNGSGTFVTAFYGVYDPKTRELQYSCAGHPPPRVKSCQGNRIYSMDCDPNLPLGISADQCYPGKAHTLRPGDQLVFYTDGITEAFNHEGDQFGVERLDAALNRCENEAPELIDAVLCDLDRFTNGAPAGDDRTLVLAKIS